MPLAPPQFQHKIEAMIAAAEANCAAAETAEPSAAKVSFQRMQPSNPLHKNINSAVSPLLPAVQFSGKIAICAEFAA